MYKVNGEQCKKCGKLFHPDAKVFRPIDSNGNPLEMELCDMCELDDMLEDIMNARHISREEASKFLWGKMHEILDEAINSMNPYNNADANYLNHPFTMERFDRLVRMVKDNEIRTD